MNADNVSPYRALRSRPPKEHGLIVSPPAWSRFVVWQLYGLAAGGSRELPNAMSCPSRLFGAADKTGP
jgi:hypothetical protein